MFEFGHLQVFSFNDFITVFPMADSSQFSPLTTLSEQLGPNSSVFSVFIPAFIANIGKHFFLKYDYQNSKSIKNILFYYLLVIFFS